MGIPGDCEDPYQMLAQMNPDISRLAGQFTTDYIQGGEDEEYLSEEEFMKTIDDQEKTIFNALVSSLFQNYMNNLKKFLKRRMEHMHKF